MMANNSKAYLVQRRELTDNSCKIFFANAGDGLEHPAKGLYYS
jgi:hypothetical protein